MRIWIDADACPKMVKDIVFGASQRTQIPVVLVANKSIHTPRSTLVSQVVVSKGQDVADQYIVDNAEAGDLVISADVPLAALLVAKGIPVIDPRGQLLTEVNVSERLSVRNFMEDLRSTGYQGGGPSGYSDKDKQRFASTFDKILTRLIRENKTRESPPQA